MLDACCRCTTHYDPNVDADASATFCGDCARKLKTLANEAEKYQNDIRAGSVNVRPINDADARKNRAALRRRYGHDSSNADTKMKTWRDAK